MKAVVLFDGDCGFCTLTIEWVKRFDRADRVYLVPFQNSEALAKLGISLEEARKAVWYVDCRGAKLSGAAAISALLSELWQTRLPARLYQVPLVGRFQEWAYRIVARHRRFLPGTRPYCRKYPDRCR